MPAGLGSPKFGNDSDNDSPSGSENVKPSNATSPFTENDAASNDSSINDNEVPRERANEAGKADSSPDFHNHANPVSEDDRAPVSRNMRQSYNYDEEDEEHYDDEEEKSIHSPNFGSSATSVLKPNKKISGLLTALLMTLAMLGGVGGIAMMSTMSGSSNMQAIQNSEVCEPADSDSGNNGSQGRSLNGIGNVNGVAFPASGTITVGFGYSEFHGGHHNGYDIAAPLGEPMYAAFDGVVVDHNPDPGGYGNYYIVLQSTDNPDVTATYGHGLPHDLQVGDEVRAGDYIQDMGSEGFSTGSHLHFTLTVAGQDVHPHEWYADNGMEIPEASSGGLSIPVDAKQLTNGSTTSEEDKQEDRRRDNNDQSIYAGGGTPPPEEERNIVNATVNDNRYPDRDESNDYKNEDGSDTWIVGDSITVGASAKYHDAHIAGDQKQYSADSGKGGELPKMKITSQVGKAFDWAYNVITDNLEKVNKKVLVIATVINGHIDENKLKEVIDQAHEKDMKVVVFTPGLDEGKPETDGTDWGEIKKIYDENTRKVKASDADIIIDWGAEIQSDSNLMADRVHPNAQGQDLLVKLLKEALYKAKKGETGTVGGSGSTTAGNGDSSDVVCKCSGESSQNSDTNGSSEPGSNVSGMEDGIAKYAPTVIAVGRYMDLSDEDIIVALGTATAESNWRILSNPGTPESAQYPNDGEALPSNAGGSYGDVLGLYQQRDSWGTVEQRMNPAYAPAAFMSVLKTKNSGGQGFGERINGVQAAAATGDSWYADTIAYFGKQEGTARDIWDQYKDDDKAQADALSDEEVSMVEAAIAHMGGDSSDDSGSSEGSQSGDSSSSSSRTSGSCGFRSSSNSDDKHGTINDPNAGEMAKEAAAAAKTRIGDDIYPEQMGTNPEEVEGIPYGLDCSGFISWAYVQAGYKEIKPNFTRFNTSSLQNWPEVDEKDAAAGDVFLSNINGSSGHAALYVGDGMLVESYTSGAPVREISVEEWKKQRKYFPFCEKNC